jgi:hypothetical protein
VRSSLNLAEIEELAMTIHPDPNGLKSLIVTAPEFVGQYEVSDEAPVQAFGTVLGRDLYFRARHDQWSFEVEDHAGNMPSDGFHDSDGFYREGKYEKASYMDLTVAVKIINRCLVEYTGIRV